MSRSPISISRRALCGAVAAATVLGLGTAGGARATPLEAGKSRIQFDAWRGPPLTVWTYKPTVHGPALPAVFVMHGVERNGETYRDQWAELAEANGFLLLTPEFSEASFPKEFGYNFGNTRLPDGEAIPAERWSFSAIEAIFEQVRKTEPALESRYRLYGHSAGAQFVHRFLYYVPKARAERVVAANAGWYTMPDWNTPFPYGLAGSDVGEAALRTMLSRQVVIMLGEKDNDPNHRFLRRTAEANAQGAHRLERGRAFFDAAKAEAERLGVPFNWRLVTVPGVGHSNEKMAASAVAPLLGR
ncbi:MAG: hypothetical protein KGP27_18175 [Hyphomicrobiales bacterium]|nr:hypothetical protein [Hyphomicrobiales bacterium]